MAPLGRGQHREVPGHGTPEAAMAAEGGQSEALHQQGVSAHYSSLMQVLAALNLAWTDPSSPCSMWSRRRVSRGVWCCGTTRTRAIAWCRQPRCRV